MKKVLVICGQTGTGKTGLGVRLAKKFNGEILSADSRQVYKGMDVGTGKDKNMIKRGRVKIWGYDLVEPEEEFSVAQYERVGKRILKDISGRGKLPIIVGGTGLYIQALTGKIKTLDVKPDFNLRAKFGGISADELYEYLLAIDQERVRGMNQSDRKNPRRLVRAIEIVHSAENKVHRDRDEKTGDDYDLLVVGLRAEKDEIERRVRKRVLKRLEGGFEKEVGTLLKRGVTWEMQSMQATGYRQWRGYVEGGKGKEEIIEEWVRAEVNYAKRQLTWFRKWEAVRWFDIGDKDWQESVEELAEKWYKVRYAKED